MQTRYRNDPTFRMVSWIFMKPGTLIFSEKDRKSGPGTSFVVQPYKKQVKRLSDFTLFLQTSLQRKSGKKKTK